METRERHAKEWQQNSARIKIQQMGRTDITFIGRSVNRVSRANFIVIVVTEYIKLVVGDSGYFCVWSC
jgi:hypothetical protein